MIEQYLSNTNEIATVLILPKNLELNNALVDPSVTYAVHFVAIYGFFLKNQKVFKIFYHIESYGTYIKH